MKKKKNYKKKNFNKRRIIFFVVIAVIVIILVTSVKYRSPQEESMVTGNCNDGIDNDFDGKCDYDGCGSIIKGDEGCPVNII